MSAANGGSSPLRIVNTREPESSDGLNEAPQTPHGSSRSSFMYFNDTVGCGIRSVYRNGRDVDVGAAVIQRIFPLMPTTNLHTALSRLFSELVDGTGTDGGFMLNRGDTGLLRSLDALSAADASRSANDGATIAAHAEHLRYGLSLMNKWAAKGGNPFADATWDAAWKVSSVDEAAWKNIRSGLRDEAHAWLQTLNTPREASEADLCGMIGSIGHLAYHLGAIRQIARAARGPREGTF